MSPPDRRIDLIVIVSGVSTPVRTNAREKLRKVMREALRETGHRDAEISEWELRTQDGRELDPTQTAAEARLVDGMTLYLSPRAGGGG